MVDIHSVLGLRLFHRDSINGFLGGNDHSTHGFRISSVFAVSGKLSFMMVAVKYPHKSFTISMIL